MKTERNILRRRSFERTNSAALAGKGLKQQMLDALIFSLAAYESTPEKVLAVLRFKYDLPVGTLDILPWEELTSDQPGPQPLLVGRSAHGQVIVACRGTADLADLVTDLKFIQKRLPFAKGSAHLGFVQRAASINIEPFLSLLESGKSIVFTGHSLGGAVASLVALRVLEEASRSGCCPHQRRVQVITFGAPLFANAGLAELINTEYRDLFHHVVSKNDLVPKILPLVAAGHRLIGGEPHHLEYLRLGRMALDLVENVAKLPVATAVRILESKIPGPVKSLASIALRLLWPGEADHQYSFAGQIVMLDRTEIAVDKAVRLTRAEELNFWCSQLGFGLGLNFGGFAEHGLANYYAALGKGMSSRLLEYLAGGNLNAESVAMSTAIVGAQASGAVMKQAIAEEDCKAGVRCNVAVEERSQWKTGAAQPLLPTFAPASEGSCCCRSGGDLASTEMEAGRECPGRTGTAGSLKLQDSRKTVARREGTGGGSHRCLACARAMRLDPSCQVVTQGEGMAPKRRGKLQLGWVLGTISHVSRQLRSLDKVCLIFSAIRLVIANPFF